MTHDVDSILEKSNTAADSVESLLIFIVFWTISWRILF